MNSRNELKTALDEALGSMKANDELRRKTLTRARGSLFVPMRYRWRPLVRYSAVIALIVGLLFYSSGNELWNKGEEVTSPEVQPSVAAITQGTNKAVMPQYVPEGYKVDEITSTAKVDNSIPDITIRFKSGDSKFMELTRSKDITKDNKEGYEQAMIEGRQGWLKVTKEGDILLVWLDKEYEYTLTGKLTEGEAKKMAGSIYLLKEEGNRK